MRFTRNSNEFLGNHMISSAIWDKSAKVNFSKANKIARTRRAAAICSLEKFTSADLSQTARGKL